MKYEKEKEFYLDSLEFICAIMDFCESVSDELRMLVVSNYEEKFRTVAEAIQRTGERIKDFTDKWVTDDDGICSSLKIIKEYYGYYCVTLGKSSPSLFHCDARYIVDSIKTSKLALGCKVKLIKNKI
jgi:hypothetical protein